MPGKAYPPSRLAAGNRLIEPKTGARRPHKAAYRTGRELAVTVRYPPGRSTQELRALSCLAEREVASPQRCLATNGRSLHRAALSLATAHRCRVAHLSKASVMAVPFCKNQQRMAAHMLL